MRDRAERLPTRYCRKCDTYYYEPQHKDRCPTCRRVLRIFPLGADKPLPPLPSEITFSEAEIDRAIERWDELMPEYQGMLDAEIETEPSSDQPNANREPST